MDSNVIIKVCCAEQHVFVSDGFALIIAKRPSFILSSYIDWLEIEDCNDV